MLRVLTAALCLAASPVAAESVFDRVEGYWAFPFVEGMRCHENPHSITFSGDRGRVAFRWDGPMVNYLGEIDQDADYTVLDHDGTSLTMTLDDEARRTAEGDPVVWILRLADDLDGYCWGRTDWPQGRCVALHVRCIGDTPVS